MLLAAALLIPLGLATLAFWHATEWATPVHLESASAESTLVVARPVPAAQAPPTLIPSRGAVAAGQTATPAASPTPHATPTDSVVANPTPATQGPALAASGGVSPNQLQQPPAISNQASAPAVRAARSKPPANAKQAPPGQVKKKPNAKHRD
jgi:predicted ribosomally synthesized peptide with SipW-like signal peptide